MDAIRVVFRNKKARQLDDVRIIPGCIRQRLADFFERHPDGYVELLLNDKIRYAFTFAQADKHLHGASI